MSSVMKITEAASLGMHTMVLLAGRPERPFTAREVAEAFKVSEAHLAKVLQRLARAGLVRSERGPKGGFSLARPGDRITLLDVYETIEGPIPKATCLFSERVCQSKDCILGDMLGDFNRQFRKYLADNRLTDLVGVYSKLRFTGGVPCAGKS
jgi:Rrf2 family protein